MPDGLILDAELVCLDAAGRPDFARLRRRLVARTGAAVEHAAAAAPATLMIFDVLWHDGKDVSPRAYDERRAVLDALSLDGPSWRTPRRFCAARDDLAAVTREHQLEGVVAKRRDAPYAPGRRSGAWIKFKHRHRERLQAIAWLPARGTSGREGLLVARVDEHGQLTPAAWYSSVSAANAGSRCGSSPASRAQTAGCGSPASSSTSTTTARAAGHSATLCCGT